MVDIHSHILPYLDDGAESMEEALNMARIAVDSGIYHMVASSHGNYYSYTLEEYRECFCRLENIIQKEKIPLTLYSGMEIFLNEKAIQRIKEKKLLTLNNTNYLLVEFSFEENPNYVCKWIDLLQKENYRIIIAHPERYLFIQRDPELAYYLNEQGCILQMNKGSLVGDFGYNCQSLAIQMLEDQIIQIIATDAHDKKYRSHSLIRVMNYLYNKYSLMEIRLWLSENPSRILKGYPTISLRRKTEKEE